MKWLGFRQVAIKSIKVDAVDIRKRQKAKHVGELAADIDLRGGEPIHAPTVRVPGNVLLCGRDRFAASLLNGTKKLWVHAVECDDDEASELELAENIYRRADNRAELIAQLVALKAQHLEAVDEQKRAAGEAVSEAPQHSPRARARKEVARAAGVSTATVKSHEKHAAKSAEEADLTQSGGGELTPPPTPAEIELPAGFQAYGLPVAVDQREGIAATLEWLKGMELEARRAVAAMTDAEKHRQFTIAPAHIQAIRAQAQALGHALREAMPAGLCPYCKSQPKLATDCAGCGGVGVVGRHAGDHVPRELLGSEVVMVAVDGKVVPLNGGEVRPKPAERRRQIQLEVVEAPSAAAESEELF